MGVQSDKGSAIRRDFYRRLATRLLLAALVIAGVFGGAVWFYEVELIEDTVVGMATGEASAFGELHAISLSDGHRLEQQLQSFLQERQRGAEGHFVIAELYDSARRSLAEASVGDTTAVEQALDRRTHPFPNDGKPHYDKVTLHGLLYVRVLTDLRAGDFTGTFEGVFEVAPSRLERIEKNIVVTVAIAIAVVLGTTLFLLPIVAGLNRHLVEASDRLLRSNVAILEVLGGAIAKRDSDTGRHNYRVTLYAVHLAQALRRAPTEIRALIKGAFLHDVGKIAISDAILLKPGKLTPEEFTVMKTHVDHGVDIVARSAWLDDATPVVAGHHEKFDGSGYPKGLVGEAIAMNARIFAVVDVFDALTSRRPYKDPMPFEKAMAILEEGRGRHFDPAVLDAFSPIAEDLHRRFADHSEEGLRDTLITLTARYF